METLKTEGENEEVYCGGKSGGFIQISSELIVGEHSFRIEYQLPGGQVMDSRALGSIIRFHRES